MKVLRTVGLFLLAFAFITNTTLAQRRRAGAQRTPAAPPVQPAVTFDNLLSEDSYKIYCEVRVVGQLLRSQSFNDIIDPIMKLAAPPKEFKTLMKWLNSESDALMTSRMLVASWPSRPKLPNVLFAIEFGSAEEAQKFEPRLKTFLLQFLPTPTPESSPRPGGGANSGKNATRNSELGDDEDAKPKKTLPPYVVKQSGALIFISDVTFNFKTLRPAGSKLFTEDQNFRRVHDRFVTESVLVYVDSGAMEREEQERRRQYEDEEQKRIEAEAANPPKADAEESTAEVAPDADVQNSVVPVSEAPDPDVIPQRQTETAQATLIAADGSEGSAPPPDVAGQAFGSLARLLFGGRTIWPGGVGAALAFEPDSYSLRVLLVNEPGVRASAIPFMPQLVSGPPLTPESPSVFPSDTEFFVTLSLDYPQIYEGLVNAIRHDAARAGINVPARDASMESPFSVYERQSGIKIKDDLIPLLGNEIALSLPMQTLDVGPGPAAPNPQLKQSAEPDSTKNASAPEAPNPVIAISIKDREGVRLLLPKLIDSFGLKGASLLAQTEKRGDTEVVTYANAFSYAFVGNFLLVSPDPKALRHVVDSYLNHETLASDSHFRNYTRWQSRQVLGQLYVSPALMSSYSAFARTLDSSITDQLRELLSRLSPTPEPVTYALSNEGQGPLHELRVPKNLALLMIAGMSGSNSQASGPLANESLVKGTLRTIVSAEMTYKATTGDGSYGSKDQLIANGLITKNVFEQHGYRIELSVGGSGFEARAMPLEYGKTGKMSFFVDETGVMRSGDHGGGPATVADDPLK
ncbi:MAG: DUF3352 domain-containing protein [Pyrinomonadaceae bacterium]